MSVRFEHIPVNVAEWTRHVSKDTTFHHAFTVVTSSGQGMDLWDAIDAAAAWCAAEFGPACHLSTNLDGRWIKITTVIYVRDNADAVAFKMRFG